MLHLYKEIHPPFHYRELYHVCGLCVGSVDDSIFTIAVVQRTLPRLVITVFSLFWRIAVASFHARFRSNGTRFGHDSLGILFAESFSDDYKVTRHARRHAYPAFF